MNISVLFAVALGGALGAVFRYILMSGIVHFIHTGFPFSTFVVNVTGSFTLGLLTEVMDYKWTVEPEMRSFLVIGVLGSFTTFSAFSQDVVFLIERGEFPLAFLYIVLSVLLSIAGILAGMYLLRQILT